MLCVEHDNIEIFCFWMFDESKLERALASSSLHWVTAEILFYFERLTLVWWRPMKSLSSICPSVTKFSQDWIISFFDIVRDDSWPWYLVTDGARLSKKGLVAQIWAKWSPETRFFLPFSQVCLISFLLNCIRW